MAKSHLGDYEEAKADFQIGLQLDADNSELKKELSAQNKKIKDAKLKEKAIYGKLFQ